MQIHSTPNRSPHCTATSAPHHLTPIARSAAVTARRARPCASSVLVRKTCKCAWGGPVNRQAKGCKTDTIEAERENLRGYARGCRPRPSAAKSSGSGTFRSGAPEVPPAEARKRPKSSSQVPVSRSRPRMRDVTSRRVFESQTFCHKIQSFAGRGPRLESLRCCISTVNVGLND